MSSKAGPVDVHHDGAIAEQLGDRAADVLEHLLEIGSSRTRAVRSNISPRRAIVGRGLTVARGVRGRIHLEFCIGGVADT